ncbi:MAG TPA: 4Fe-4S dicluster domain-containing protein [Chloroflexia bacterium]|nr:4Fe-4S dicluster domain-containing protein [Chloroflexia bacterium]
MLNPNLKLTPRPGIILAASLFSLLFWIIGLAIWFLTSHLGALLRLGYLGCVLAIGLATWASLPRAKRSHGRRLILVIIGSFLFFAILGMGVGDIQVEGFFFALWAGASGNAFYHYLIAKFFGPLLFGRIWCGWACWTAMILDLLPFKRSQGRLPEKFGWIRDLHFALSMSLTLLLAVGSNYANRFTNGSATGLYWFLAGNIAYYILGITLAYVLKDNRAFCKYLCPVSVPLKLGSRFALLKIKGDRNSCNSCGACSRVCPMNIDVRAYIKEGSRVLSTECILCQTCVGACPRQALQLSFGLDRGRPEKLIITRSSKLQTVIK